MRLIYCSLKTIAVDPDDDNDGILDEDDPDDDNDGIPDDEEDDDGKTFVVVQCGEDWSFNLLGYQEVSSEVFSLQMG